MMSLMNKCVSSNYDYLNTIKLQFSRQPMAGSGQTSKVVFWPRPGFMQNPIRLEIESQTIESKAINYYTKPGFGTINRAERNRKSIHKAQKRN